MRRLLVGVVAVGLLVYGGSRLWQSLSSSFGSLIPASPVCTANANSIEGQLDPEQTSNAALISAVALQRGLPARAVTIALATAMQESKLYNLPGGDRDSLGLFQQRPSVKAWGTETEIMDPVHAANAFFDALVKIRNYETRPIGEVAQAVQRSADGEDGLSYAQHEPTARAFASALAGFSAHALKCEYDTTNPAKPETLSAQLTVRLPSYVRTPVVRGDAMTIPVRGSDTHGWAVAHYVVARALELGINQVSYGGWTWTPKDGWKGANATGDSVVATFATSATAAAS